uniref:Uncharacterized protein n=1 Tax=Tanacetum cinerariifolium TaxID=118510 RepID=A0A6L2LJF7_TANCI|nr:hypothetical protein [Tanacetum cinerariifolium]
MSNKRTSKRKPRISKKFHDHIMGNQSHKKAGLEQFENVDEIKVYRGMDNVGENIMDDNVCNVSPSKPCLDDEINNADYNSQVSNDQFCLMNETNPIINEEPIQNTKSYANIVQSNEIQLDTSLDFTPTIHVWAKIRDVPLEAWTKEGISALASSLGKPIRMDKITAQKCKDVKGRVEYARVLVEFDVDKGFKEEICIQYMSKDNVIRGTKKVKVEYVWKPHICSQCKVFGHRDEKCSKFKRMSEGNEQDKMKNKESINVEEVGGFTQVRYRKKFEAKRNDMIEIEEDRLKEAEEKNEKNGDVLIGENIAVQRCFANDVNEEETYVLN